MAKRLRAEGRSEDAAEVGRLRKPDATAWALNQAVRSDPAALRGARDAAAGLRRAQEDAVAGRGDRDDLRRAMREEREAVQRLVARAAEEAGRGGVRLDEERAAATIHAANADPELGAALDAGRLVRWSRDASLGAIPEAPATRSKPSNDREEAARARRRAAEIRKAEGAVATARKKRDRAAGRVEKARAELARLEQAESAAASELAEAEGRLGGLEGES